LESLTEAVMADIKETIIQAMKAAGEPLKAGQIIEMTGLEKADVDKAMKLLKKEELIVSPKRCFWEPK